jgi:hypothetical protein
MRPFPREMGPGDEVMAHENVPVYQANLPEKDSIYNNL